MAHALVAPLKPIRYPFEKDAHWKDRVHEWERKKQAWLDAVQADKDRKTAEHDADVAARQAAKDDKREDREDRITARQSSKTERVSIRQGGKSTRTASKAAAGYYDVGPSEALNTFAGEQGDIAQAGASVVDDLYGSGAAAGLLGDLAGAVGDSAGASALDTAKPWIVGGLVLLGGLGLVALSRGSK